jgi:O-antigen ligase
MTVRRERTIETLVAIALCGCVAAVIYRYGVALTAFALILAGLIGLSAASSRLLTLTLVLLAPLPSLGAIVGVDLPLGAEPVDLLVAIGLVICLLRRGPVLRPVASRKIVWLLALNIGVLTVAWLRTYGDDAFTGSNFALIIKPALLMFAGFVVVTLLPREDVVRTVASAMGIALLVVAASVVLQRVGLYTTSYQVDNLTALGSKQYGGLLLNGNTAGALMAIFTLPVFVLLRTTGRAWFATVVLLAAFPVLLLTLSRGSIAGFAVALAVFVVVEQRRIAWNLRLAIGVVAVGGAFALTIGQAQTEFIVSNFERYQYNTNGQLSGREGIWEQAFHYLDEEPSRWVVGGGLDDFRSTNRVGIQGFATHNQALFLVVNGGIVMLACWLLLAAWLALARGVTDPALRSALRLAVAAVLVVGLTQDVNPFTETLAWLWLLAAVAYLPADGLARRPERNPLEPVIAPLPQPATTQALVLER